MTLVHGGQPLEFFKPILDGDDLRRRFRRVGINIASVSNHQEPIIIRRELPGPKRSRVVPPTLGDLEIGRSNNRGAGGVLANGRTHHGLRCAQANKEEGASVPRPAVVYEMVTGQRAFTGDSQASLIGAILKDPHDPLSAFDSAVPSDLDHLVGMCLAKTPENRWQNAHDVASQLRWIVDHGAPVSSTAQVAPRDRSRLLWTAAVCALLAGSWLQWRTSWITATECHVTGH